MFVKRSFSSDRNAGELGVPFPPLCQLLAQHHTPQIRLRAVPRTSPRRCNSSRPVHHPTESADLHRCRQVPAYTATEGVMDAVGKRSGSALRSSSAVRRRPEQREGRERTAGGITPLRCTVAKPLDITTSVRRVLDLIKGPTSDTRERSPMRFRKSHLRRPIHSPDTKPRYHPARFVTPDSVPHTTRLPEQVVFQPSACKVYLVDLRVLQENTVGRLQREMELRRLEEVMFAEVRGNSILKKQPVKEGGENEQPKSVTFADIPC